LIGTPASLDNLMLLCRRHHTLVHEGGISIEGDVLAASPRSGASNEEGG
jgi:predicted restriction endonuclease